MWWKKKKEQPRRRQISQERIAEEHRQSDAGQQLFRRNRTLTGSRSAAVSSAAELDADLRSPRAHVHHLVAHRRRLGSVLSFVLLAIAFLLWLIYEFTAFVHVSPTDSGVVLQQGRYEKIINDYLAIHPIERLRLLTNDTELDAYMKRQAPEVANLHSTGAAGFATGQFQITLREPTAGWLIGNQQYFVDDSGIAFQINYFEQPAVKITDESGVPQSAGTAVASTRFLQFVGRSVAVAHDYGLTVQQAIIPSGTTRQVELRVADHKYPIKLSLDRPVAEQVEDMQRAVAYMDSKHLTPQYIDVRVSGKAYYK